MKPSTLLFTKQTLGLLARRTTTTTTTADTIPHALSSSPSVELKLSLLREDGLATREYARRWAERQRKVIIGKSTSSSSPLQQEREGELQQMTAKPLKREEEKDGSSPQLILGEVSASLSPSEGGRTSQMGRWTAPHQRLYQAYDLLSSMKDTVAFSSPEALSEWIEQLHAMASQLTEEATAQAVYQSFQDVNYHHHRNSEVEEAVIHSTATLYSDTLNALMEAIVLAVTMDTTKQSMTMKRALQYLKKLTHSLLCRTDFISAPHHRQPAESILVELLQQTARDISELWKVFLLASTPPRNPLTQQRLTEFFKSTGHLQSQRVQAVEKQHQLKAQHYAELPLLRLPSHPVEVLLYPSSAAMTTMADGKEAALQWAVRYVQQSYTEGKDKEPSFWEPLLAALERAEERNLAHQRLHHKDHPNNSVSFRGTSQFMQELFQGLAKPEKVEDKGDSMGRTKWLKAMDDSLRALSARRPWTGEHYFREETLVYLLSSLNRSHLSEQKENRALFLFLEAHTESGREREGARRRSILLESMYYSTLLYLRKRTELPLPSPSSSAAAAGPSTENITMINVLLFLSNQLQALLTSGYTQNSSTEGYTSLHLQVEEQLVALLTHPSTGGGGDDGGINRLLLVDFFTEETILKQERYFSSPAWHGVKSGNSTHHSTATLEAKLLQSYTHAVLSGPDVETEMKRKTKKKKNVRDFLFYLENENQQWKVNNNFLHRSDPTAFLLPLGMSRALLDTIEAEWEMPSTEKEDDHKEERGPTEGHHRVLRWIVENNKNYLSFFYLFSSPMNDTLKQITNPSTPDESNNNNSANTVTLSPLQVELLLLSMKEDEAVKHVLEKEKDSKEKKKNPHHDRNSLSFSSLHNANLVLLFDLLRYHTLLAPYYRKKRQQKKLNKRKKEKTNLSERKMNDRDPFQLVLFQCEGEKSFLLSRYLVDPPLHGPRPIIEPSHLNVLFAALWVQLDEVTDPSSPPPSSHNRLDRVTKVRYDCQEALRLLEELQHRSSTSNEKGKEKEKQYPEEETVHFIRIVLEKLKAEWDRQMEEEENNNNNNGYHYYNNKISYPLITDGMIRKVNQLYEVWFQ